MTCLSIHPNEDCIATGASNGKIIIWYNYFANDMDQENNGGLIHYGSDLKTRSHSVSNNKPTMNVLHWHSLPVLSICFTTEGSYLLSGGHECVLVKWMFKSGQKDFKPRLAAPIGEIFCSKDNTLYATQHLDNSKIDFLGNFNFNLN